MAQTWTSSYDAPILVSSNEPLVVSISRVNAPTPLLMMQLRASGQGQQALSGFGISATYAPVVESERVASVGDLMAEISASRQEFWQVQPWRDVEEIANHVQGDGTDPMRMALADSIRQHQRGFAWKGGIGEQSNESPAQENKED